MIFRATECLGVLLKGGIIHDGGIEVIFLPAKGHLFNPAEVFINAVQQSISRWHPPGSPVDDHDHAMVGPRNYEECRSALSAAIDGLTPKAYQGFYNKRMQGADFLRRVESSVAYRQVSNERQEVAVVQHWPASLK